MLKILVADDDAGIREILAEILISEGHKVVEAADGALAKDLLIASDFDLIISDMQMPNLSGIELLQWVKKEKPLPFLLITGFSNLFETKKAFDLGANEFLTKPFARQDIRAAIARAQEHDSNQVQDSEKHYCRIPIDDFVSGDGFQVSVYAKLSETKFVKVAHKGDPIPAERVDTYQKKGVNFLYAKKEEFARVVGFNLEISSALKVAPKIPRKKKLRFMQYTTELVLENVFVNGLDLNGLNQASQCLQMSLSVISENDELFDVIDVLNKHSDWLYAHSLGVSLYSVMIARSFGWKSQTTLFKLAAAGLFHDIGCKEIPETILLKNRFEMTPAERKIYETHPSRSYEILNKVGGLCEEIVQIVHEHHEEGVGQGYPRKVARAKIHPLVRVIAVADKFAELIMTTPGRTPMPVSTAIATIASHAHDELDHRALAALRLMTSAPAENLRIG